MPRKHSRMPRAPPLLRAPSPGMIWIAPYGRGRSSVVEHNLAKVGVEGSNPFARSKDFKHLDRIQGEQNAVENVGKRQNTTRILGETLGRIREK